MRAPSLLLWNLSHAQWGIWESSTGNLILEKLLHTGCSNSKLCPETRGVQSPGATNQWYEWTKTLGLQWGLSPHLQNGMTSPSPKILVGIKGDTLCKRL